MLPTLAPGRIGAGSKQMDWRMHTRTAPIDPARVLFPLGLGTALSLIGDSTIYTVLPTHVADAGVSLASVGILLGVNRAIRLFLNGPAGLAYNRWPRRRLFVPALFVGALSTALYAATRGFWPLFTARMLWGLAWSGIWVGGATMILDVTTDSNRGRWIGLYQTWFFLGSAFGSLAGGFLTDLVGYVAAMWIGAALTALGGIVAWALLPETRSATRQARPHAVGHGPALSRLKIGGALGTAALLLGVSRFVSAGVVAATLGLVVRNQLQPLARLLGVATLTGLFMGLRTLLSMVAAPLGGGLSDRAGGRWGVTASSVALGTVGLLLMAWGTPLGIIVGVLLSSASAGCVQSLSTALTGDLVEPGQRGAAIGLLHTSGDLGSAIGPSLGLALLPFVGLRGVFLVCAALFLATLPPVLHFRRREHAAPAEAASP